MNNLQKYLNHGKIDVIFKQNKDDFVVTEVPLYDFLGCGEHLIIKFRKKNLTTWDALCIFADHFGCKQKEIGYAGLKDKNAMTIQSISIHKNYENRLSSFNHEKIKILETNYHKNKIKIGHLKGNNFFIRLKRVFSLDAKIIEQVLKQISNFGIPNYFGFQRFGIEGDNYKKGEAIIKNELKEKNRKLRQMYINSYQSYLFNNWLSKRVEISKLIDAFDPKEIYKKVNLPLNLVKEMKLQKHPFKIMYGDILSHYPYGKIFYAENLEEEALKFYNKNRVPTGLLPGKRVKQATSYAFEYEKNFTKILQEDGARRFSWIFPTNITSCYKEDKKCIELSFFLPKGSYATQLISELLHTF